MTCKTFCDLASSLLPLFLLYPVHKEWLPCFPACKPIALTLKSSALFLPGSSFGYTMMFLLSPSSGICLTVILSVKSILTFLFLHSIHYYLTCCIFYLYCFLICLLSLGRKFMQGRSFICFIYFIYCCMPQPLKESQAYRSFS